jgi:hypothetical protein
MTAVDASHEFATKADLQVLNADLQILNADLQTDLQTLKADLRVEMHQMETRLTRWTVGTMLGGMTAAAAIAAAVPALAN